MISGTREPGVTFEEVDVRVELESRPNRPPNYEAEHRALAALATEMTENPRNMLQKLVEMAVELCAADTAGISILEGNVFRWESLAGVFASRRNNTMPRDASPCGVCIDQNATQLMYLADRCFPALTAEPRFVEALLVPFHHQDKPVGTVWIVAHNYERKFDREDERIVQSLARFASAGWQLWKAYETEAESSRHKDEFLAMLGHELRNPLAAILNAKDILQNLPIDDSRAVRAIGVVARQSLHLRRMVEDLIDLTRISHGKLKLQKERIELRAVIDQSVEATRARFELRRQRLSTNIPDAPIALDADPIRLTQLLSNLLDNAAKYTPDGGKVSIEVTLEEDHVCIAVRDSGIGIPKEQLEGIFDLFTQLDESHTTASRGLGVGLALVRSLAELHGGSIDAASWGPGQGSLFTVCLPISAASWSSATAKKLVKQVPGSTVGRRILLVEDNFDCAESMAELLAMYGHVVDTAQDGAVALDMLSKFEPDVVLLDVGLPGIDGYQVARRVRTQTTKANLIVITLSGYGDSEHRRLSKEAGCNGHLVKPVQPDVLLNLLNRAIGTA
jgi:signal transduction histidine kinase